MPTLNDNRGSGNCAPLAYFRRRIINKLKQHFEDHKELYVGLGVGIAIAGITGIIMRGRYEALALGGTYGLKTADTSVTMRPLSFLSKQDNIVNVIARSGRGHPGYIIQSLDTLEYFSSQREAASIFQISETLLSKHLSGKIPDVKGYRFARFSFAS